MQAFGRMPAVRTPEALQDTRLNAPWSSASPLRDKAYCFNHDRFRGYVSVHFRSGLRPPCLRFAVYVTGHHARLGARVLASLSRGRHLRRLAYIRLQGATLTDPYVSLSTYTARATARRLPPVPSDKRITPVCMEGRVK